MEEFKVSALARSEIGSAAVRRIRRMGRVPGVIYGAAGESLNITVAQNELVKHLESEAFYSHILNVDVGGSVNQAVLKDVQRDPRNWAVIHVDFLRVDAAHEIRMMVPLHFVNEETAPGRRAGGAFTHTITEVEVSCLPKDLPEFIEVDVGAMELGQGLHLSQIQLPAGVSFTQNVSDQDHDHVVASLHEVFDAGGTAAEGEAEA